MALKHVVAVNAEFGEGVTGASASGNEGLAVKESHPAVVIEALKGRGIVAAIAQEGVHDPSVEEPVGAARHKPIPREPGTQRLEESPVFAEADFDRAQLAAGLADEFACAAVRDGHVVDYGPKRTQAAFLKRRKFTQEVTAGSVGVRLVEGVPDAD